MMRDRRGFLCDALMFAAASGMPVRLFGAAAELDRPDLRLGVLSDIHIHLAPGDDPARSESVMLFRKALEYFRDRRVDGVLIAGDLADQGLDIELKAVADTWFGVFPDGKLPDGSPVANLNPRLRAICPTYFPAARRLQAKKHGKETILEKMPEACFKGVHVVITVPPGGKTFRLAQVDAGREDGTILNEMEIES